MSIPAGHTKNFDTMVKAAKNGDLALLECIDVKTGAPVYTIVMMNPGPGGSVDMAPVAKMFDGNPYEELVPPQ